MFSGAGAESLCRKEGSAQGYSITGSGAGANLSTVGPSGPRTMTARDVPFPMVDPYQPVNRARVPVPGYNVWPPRANRLRRRYYGLAAAVETAKPETARAVKKPGFAGMGSFFDEGKAGGTGGVVALPGTPPIGSSGGGGIDWDVFFGGLFRTLPATIGAVTGRGAPVQYALPSQQQYGQYGVPPEGYYYDSSGRLIRTAVSNTTNFITENPILVGGAILGAVLLFMRPPGRR